jgi:MFS family permease
MTRLQEVLAALRQKEFRSFLAAAFLSNIGSWMQSVAQAWLVLDLTHSPFYLGLDGFANTIPLTIFSFWGGVVADRFDRRRTLLWIQWAQMALAFGLGFLTQTRYVNVWQVIGFSFLTGLTQAISWPVYQSVIANVVHREHLSHAVALNSAQFNSARMIGPVLGALALSVFGNAGCFYANAASFLPVILVLDKLRIPSNRRVPPETDILPIVGSEMAPPREGLLGSLREGLSRVLERQALRWVLLMLAVGSILGVPLLTLLPVFARDVLKIGASGLGVLIGSFGTGAVLGGILVAVLGDFPSKGLWVMRAFMLFVASMLAFCFSNNVLFSVLCMVFAGFAMVSYTSVINTLVQKSVPDELRGRALSVFVFAFGGCMPFGNLLAGSLAKHLGAPHTLLLQGTLLGVITLYVFLAHREVRLLA